MPGHRNPVPVIVPGIRLRDGRSAEIFAVLHKLKQRVHICAAALQRHILFHTDTAAPTKHHRAVLCHKLIVRTYIRIKHQRMTV